MAVTAPQTGSESSPVVQLDTDNNETTRVFVSGLPPKITRTQLADHFGSKYKVTDAHVFADRRIGFVGFQDAATAKSAAQHFNRSYIRMSKISADLAKPVQIARDSSGNAIPKSEDKRRGAHQQSGEKRKRPREDEGDHLREPTNQPSVQTDSSTLREPQLSAGEDKEDLEAESSRAQDNDWLRGKTSRTLDLEDPQEAAVPRPRPVVDGDDEMQSNELPEKVLQESQAVEAVTTSRTAVPNARLFLRNLAFDSTEQDLRSRFSEFGKVQEVHIVRDKKSASSKGTAFVQFAESQQAEDALAAIDGTSFQGRLLHVLPSSDKREKSLTEYDISQMPLKKQKAVRRKLEASKATFSWNSLYMNPDAVVSSIADRLGVSKADILDPTSADAAVKQAHAETQLIKETKEYLAASGVNIDAFKHKERDSCVLLLKNFPYGTTEAELRALTDAHGSITKFILPPAGTMAIVQYDEPSAASQALKSLAYKNVKGSVLYLEKAPVDIMTAQTHGDMHPAAVVATSPDDHGPTTTVFVRNLNFSTTTARLTDLTKALPGFVKAHVKTRTDAKKPGQLLSMGFGFVEFSSKSSAEAAVAALDKHSLDGHELVVQLSSKTTDVAEETRQRDANRKKANQQTKIIIKNLPFQVSKKDIRSLFTQYGQLKMVRVPRKFDNTARGFAFAEFVTPKEAESAMEALSNTHLLGRRLVLEYAEEEAIDPEEEIRAIERKVEQQSERVNFSRLTGSTRKKFNIDSAQEDDMS